MRVYDYYEAVKDDIREAIENGEYEVNFEEETRDRIFDRLYDDMWIDDSITGNASGSYTFNAYKAEENLVHNLYLLGEALAEFGYSETEAGKYIMSKGAEACDVTIRCYLLGQALSEVLDEMDE